jgi:hypothetical protein
VKKSRGRKLGKNGSGIGKEGRGRKKGEIGGEEKGGERRLPCLDLLALF